MKLIYEKQVNGENKLFYSNENIPTENDVEILPEQVQKINEIMQELDQQLDPEIEGSLANTVDDVVTEIGSDETADTILGRISALESGGGWEEVNFSDIDFTFSANTDWVSYRKAWRNTSSRMIMICFAMSTSNFSYQTTNTNLGTFSGGEYMPLPSKNNGMFTSTFSYQDVIDGNSEIKCGDVAITAGGAIFLGGGLIEGHTLSINVTMMYAY